MSAIRDTLGAFVDYQDIALLALRLLVGFLFVYSGFGKLKKLSGFAEHNGLPLPVAFLVVCAEFFGGWMVGLGVFPQIGALFIMIVMSGSMYHHIIKWKSPYWAASGGWEYDLMWFTMAFTILLSGGGSLALYG